jgi:CHAT domain-containing protein
LNEKNPDYIENIFYFEELMHARALKDDINRVDDINTKPEEFENYIHLCKKFQQLQRQLRVQRNTVSQEGLDSLLSQLQIYKYDIVNEKIRLGNLDTIRTDSVPPPQLTDIQQKLENQTALLFHITNRHSYVLAIQSDTSLIVPLSVSRTEMDSLVTSIMRPFHNINTSNIMHMPFFADAAFTLYEKLIEPIEHQMQLQSQILIVPSGSLGNLPFDILLREAPSRPSYTLRDQPDYAHSFLSHKYEFYYCPSTFILLQQPEHCSASMLIVADPFKGKAREKDNDFTLRFRTGWRFDPLPYAHLEASSIRKLCRKSRVIKHDKATEKKIIKLAAQQSILHIASHAFVDTTFDIFSGLALAYDNDNDGLLMGFEIANSIFPCNLVTLSACETGRGKLIKGEGALGLPRQFLLAGSRSVIMSKWKVDDAFTADFMPRFYQHYLLDGRAKVSALAQAKREILTSINPEADYHYQHPFFWAAFSLYGDAGMENETLATSSPKTNYFFFFLAGLFIAGGALFYLVTKRKKA